ncbi:zinc finger MIZ domain-containing protein 1-like [Uloborus diversus]|uniref:zinc finger MIZ domain-containing protein 1-like n=1 Tax=Uloborus diversus TaxID=327109 RepID=UPI002409ED97|nr:zinc finger MIZ domain-containing protein 1-like [Uloborus diversus]
MRMAGYPQRRGLLSVWCEELGRLLLLRHQKDRNEQKDSAVPTMHQTMHKPPHMAPGPHSYSCFSESSSMAPLGWQQAPGAPPSQGPQQQQQQLSVVTTVWGVTTSTQSGGPMAGSYGGTHTTMAQGAPYSGGQPGGTYPGSMTPKSYPPGMGNRQNGPGYNG